MQAVNALGIYRSGRSWAVQAGGRPAASIPALDGALLVDDASLDNAAQDFGHFVHHRPSAVLAPRSGEDVARMVAFAREQGLRIAPRGRAKSAFGQSQVEGGIVIEMRSLDQPPVFSPGRVEVSAGMTWRQVLAASLAHGLRPPVMAQTAYLSVGGTLSFGGVDGGSFHNGAVVDHVLELQVVTGEGRIETCSPAQNRELFEAVLAGLGQCGVILRASLPLIPAHTHARTFELLYRDLATLLADERQLIPDGRFDRAIGYAMSSASGGWVYYLLASRNFTPPELPEEQAALAGLHHLRGFERISSLPYFDSAGGGRGRAVGGWFRGRANLPHPWFAVLLPGSSIDEFAAQLFAALKPTAHEPDFLVEFHRLDPAHSSRPLFRLPDEAVVFLVVVLSTYDDPRTALEAVERNRRMFERARRLGGTCIPAGALPLSRQDWREHFGPAWQQFERAKRRFDPDLILSPGLGIF